MLNLPLIGEGTANGFGISSGSLHLSAGARRLNDATCRAWTARSPMPVIRRLCVNRSLTVVKKDVITRHFSNRINCAEIVGD
jgi:hypothetical protein